MIRKNNSNQARLILIFSTNTNCAAAAALLISREKFFWNWQNDTAPSRSLSRMNLWWHKWDSWKSLSALRILPEHCMQNARRINDAIYVASMRGPRPLSSLVCIFEYVVTKRCRGKDWKLSGWSKGLRRAHRPDWYLEPKWLLLSIFPSKILRISAHWKY